MPMLRNYTKKVACIEGDWGGPRDKRSVEPVLRILEANVPGEVLLKRCSTVEEFRYHMDQIARLPSFEIIYLAFHGTPGRIQNYGPLDIALEDLADIMGRRFEGRIIHFGACSTLKVSQDRISQFIEATRVTAVTGFDLDVDWVESTAFDLLLFALWQDYRQIAAFKRNVQKVYGELGQRLGFRIYTVD